MVERMLLYLYVLDYNSGSINTLRPDAIPQVVRDEEELNTELKTHVTMYAMTDRYDIPSLSIVTKTKFKIQIRDL